MTETLAVGEKDFRVEGKLTIKHTEIMREALFRAYLIHRSLAVDLSGVSEIDFVGLQLLIDFKKIVSDGDDTVSYINLSPEVRDKIKNLGVNNHFDELFTAFP